VAIGEALVPVRVNVFAPNLFNPIVAVEGMLEEYVALPVDVSAPTYAPWLKVTFGKAPAKAESKSAVLKYAEVVPRPRPTVAPAATFTVPVALGTLSCLRHFFLFSSTSALL